MNHRPPLWGFIGFATLLAWSGGSSTGCAPESTARKHRLAPLVGSGYSVVSDSLLDTSNHYLSTVRIVTALPNKRGTSFSTCTGVLIHPRLVLTAGHCVCQAHPGTTAEDAGVFTLDASQCAKTASISTVRYASLTDEQRAQLPTESEWPTEGVRRVGRVRAHPNLKIHYISETERRELSSNADLAVIALDQSLDARFRTVPLADEHVHIAESVVLVGYGITRPESANEGLRRIGVNEVASVEEPGGKTFRIAKPLLIPATYSEGESLLLREDASYALQGDSGGPCFRESDKTLELVGIAKTSYTAPVAFSEYTSTYFYRDWLRQEIERARRAPPATPSE